MHARLKFFGKIALSFGKIVLLLGVVAVSLSPLLQPLFCKSVLSLAGFALMASLVGLIGIWIFRPVDRAAKDREHPTQFTIVDFFCLFFIIQLAMAVIHWQFGVGEGEEAALTFAYILDAFCWFACGALWIKSVQLMSRAGIQKPLHRVLFLAYIIPATLVGALATPALLSFTLIAIFNKPTNESFFNLPVLLTSLCIMPLILYASAESSRRIVAAAEPTPPALAQVKIAE